MRLLRLILLTGTVLPGLALMQPAGASPGPILMAQGGPDERGPRGGEPPHGGPRPERPPQERPGPPPGPPPAARERPEPRPERAPPPRERPEPPAQRQPQAEPPPRERAPERRPDRQPDIQERAAPERPAPEQRRTPERPPADRPGPDRRDPDRPPPRDPAPAPRAAPERPAQPQRGPDQDRRAPDQERAAPRTAPNPPAQLQRAPDQERRAPGEERAAPDAAPDAPARRRDPAPDRGAPTQRPGGPDAAPPPNAAPGVPGRPVQRLDAQPGAAPPPNAEPGRPVPPNMAPGVPGRPVQRPDAQPGAQTQPGAEPARPLPPNMAPGVPGRPVQPPGPPPGPNAPPPPPGAQPGQPPAGGPGGRGAFNTPGQPGYVPGGFRADDDVRDYDQVRRDRREFSEGGRTFYREPGRIIVRDRDGYLIRHDENERFRDLDPRGFRSERRGADFYSFIDRPGGEQIVTVTDDDGRLLRRYRRFRDGREVVIIDNSYAGPPRPIYDDVVVLPPPDIRIPRDRYVVEYEQADEGAVYEALTAPPVVAVDRRYTLDQVRYSPDLRARMRSVDIDTITFDTASFTVTPDQAARLSVIAAAINRAIRANPQEVFLIEGYTDAVGSDIDNLSLSDRRAQSVATVLTQQFQVPPENLTTQGYGEQYLKVNTQGAARENRRVTVRRITPLLQQGTAQAAPR
ncbi:outer membrane protein OmpA-like peptidoglycan-associated protein [Methylobacterium brachiatum]|uniref:Outer membrane protein OmpA-like peptidoglycan-associated protein n=1 Tax=Methylobacterium brachiatum TaxID=269660 RepID=A0AAJ1TJ35_9HYPH|nr:OmpA family protein [Methylobacterium brachiatum]MCB4803580.1 OmpA family protein [Methylobacterium brachiatum]MDQ0542017.1 outer membrane protein OmpA-like peptidoglycan-associated protein [Methylobacterium brachiatum]